MLRRVVRGDSAACACTWLGAAAMGCALDRGISLMGLRAWCWWCRIPFIMSGASSESLGEPPREGALGPARDRGMADVDCEAWLPSALARSFCAIMMLMSDGRDVRLTLDGT